MNNNLKIPLFAQKDRNGNTFYIGRCQFPGTINFTDGCSFVIFTAISGEEEMQVANFNEKDRQK